MATLDIFSGDAFTVRALTDAINKVAFAPSRLGQIIDWFETGVTTTGIMIEEQSGVLQLLNPSARGGPGATSLKDKRTLRSLNIPHYQHDDAVMADEVQGVRAFGSETELMTIQDLVNARMEQHVMLKHQPTLEFQRLGATKGIILNADGSTYANLFTEFGVTQEDEVDFDLDNASPVKGALRKACDKVVRTMRKNMAGANFGAVRAITGDAFWDDLIAHPEARETYLNTAEARDLRGGTVYQEFSFGGIIWENYRGGVNGDGTTPGQPTEWVNTDKCHIFPVQSPGLWRTVFAPADYIETVNTVGLPYYAKQYRMPNDKGIHLETQMNALSYCTRPKSLMKGKRT